MKEVNALKNKKDCDLQNMTCIKRIFLAWALLFQSETYGTSLCLSIEAGLDKMCARAIHSDKDCTTTQSDIVAWHPDSCVLNKGDEVAPEILALTNGADVPASIYQKYSAEKIAISLIYRYFQKIERPQIKKIDLLKPSYDVFGQTESIIAFSSKNIDSIIKNGFLNQFTLGTKPRYENYMQNRVLTENYLSGVNLSATFEIGSTPENLVRPKYAHGIFRSAGTARIRNYLDFSYGDTYAVLKDSVKKRTTLTNYDSLAGVVSQIPNFKVISMYQSSNKFEFPALQSYYETQIWGPVAITDVAYFLIGCSRNESDSQIADALNRMSINVPVYKCKMLKENGVTRPVPVHY